MPTQLRVSACPFSAFGTMAGFVREISPDIVTSNLSASSGVLSTSQAGSFYNVIIDTEGRDLVSNQQETFKLLPGAEGELTIISRGKTVMLSFLRRKASLITRS